MKYRIVLMLTATLIAANLLGGCSKYTKDTILPETLISKAVTAYELPKTYYSEAKLDVYENDQISEKCIVKEWVDNSSNKTKMRYESDSKISGKTVTTNDGSKILSYSEKEKTAFYIKTNDTLSENSSNFKDQFIKQLNTLSQTHDITYKGEETINGFKTYHLHAKPKEKNTLIGEVNFWIEQNNWFIVKNTSDNANTKVVIEYTKLDFSPKFNKDLFVQDIPSDVKIEEIDSDGSENNKIDMKQAEEKAGKPLLTLLDSSEYKLKNITCDDLPSLKRYEINQTFEKNDIEEFVITTMVYYDNKTPSNSSDLKMNGEKELTVRGKNASAIDDIIKNIAWTEDNFKYSLLIHNPTITIEEGVKIIESLKYNGQ